MHHQLLVRLTAFPKLLKLGVISGRVPTDKTTQIDPAAPDTTATKVNGNGGAPAGEDEVEQALEGTNCPPCLNHHIWDLVINIAHQLTLRRCYLLSDDCLASCAGQARTYG